MEDYSDLEPRYLDGNADLQETYPRSLGQRAKLGVAACTLAISPFVAAETNLGDTPLVNECQIRVTDQTKIDVNKLLDSPMSMNVTRDSYHTDQLQHLMAAKAKTLGLHVFKSNRTLEQINTNNDTLSQSQAAKENFKVTQDFLGKYGVDLTLADTFSDFTQGHVPANEDTLHSKNVQDMLPRLIRSFSYLPVEYVTEVAGLDRIAFAKWYRKNPTIAYAHQPYAAGPRTIYVNVDKTAQEVDLTVDNPIQHEIGHHAIAGLCNTDTLDIKKDAQLSDENVELQYTGDTLSTSAEQTARNLHDQQDISTADVNFVSEYSSTALTENQSELISYITTPPTFGVATSKRFPKVRMQTSHILGLLYQKNPQVAEYFISVGNRR